MLGVSVDVSNAARVSSDQEWVFAVHSPTLRILLNNSKPLKASAFILQSAWRQEICSCLQTKKKFNKVRTFPILNLQKDEVYNKCNDDDVPGFTCINTHQ